MKGKLTKTEQGWAVKYILTVLSDTGVRTYYDRELPLRHEDSKDTLKNDVLTLFEGREVEFEIVTVYEKPSDSIHCNRGSDIHYANLVNVAKVDYNMDMTPAEQLKSIANKLENKVMPANHICRYSKSMNQQYPRLCVDCGKPESYTFTVKNDVKEVTKGDLPTTTSDLIDSAIWSLPFDERIKCWDLIERLVEEETATLYTDKEVLDILNKFLNSMLKNEKTGLIEKWFEQFKKSNNGTV